MQTSHSPITINAANDHMLPYLRIIQTALLRARHVTAASTSVEIFQLPCGSNQLKWNTKQKRLNWHKCCRIMTRCVSNLEIRGVLQTSMISFPLKLDWWCLRLKVTVISSLPFQCVHCLLFTVTWREHCYCI